MEFGKAKRFLEPRFDNELGPGSYDVVDAEARYKHGAMLEKAARFEEGAEGTDTFGLYDVGGKENARPKVKSAASSERMQLQMEDMRHRLTTQHEKDLRKVQSKLTKLELARDELVKDRNDIRNEVGVLKVEIRSSTARETALRASLDKSESSLGRHVKSLPLLQRQLDDFNKSHSDSRKRKEVEIAELKREVADAKLELETAERHLTTEKSRGMAFAAELADATTLLSATQSAHSTLSFAAAQLLASRPTISFNDLDSLRNSSHASLLRIARLERQLSTAQAQVSALVDLSTELNTSGISLRSLLKERDSQMEYMMDERAWERSLKRNDKDWRQRCRTDFREAVALNQEIELLTRSQAIESEYVLLVSKIASERELESAEERKILEDELAIAEGELDLAINEEIPFLEQQTEAAEQRMVDAVEMQATLQATLEHTEAILQDLEESSKEMLEAYEGELEELKRALGEKVAAGERLEKEKKKIVTRLSQTRSAEQGLREELAASQATLSHLPALLARNAELHSTVDELSRRTASAELDARELADINSEFAGNDNPLQQKIQLLSRVRGELMDSRKAHLATTSTLSTAVSTNAALLNELNAYRSISSSTPDLTTFTASLSRSRSLLPDGMSTEGQRSRVSRMVLEEDEDDDDQERAEVRNEDVRRKRDARDKERANVVVRRAGRMMINETIREEIEEEGGALEGNNDGFKRSDEVIGQEGYRMVGKMSVSDLL